MKTDTCGQAKTIRMRYRADTNIFENGNKKLRFQMKTAIPVVKALQCKSDSLAG